MLNRRILRIKAFKAVYSIAENPAVTLKEALSQLDSSCEATRDLYLFMMSLAQPLTDEARSRMEAARSKFNPTAQEKNPNLRFIENSIAPALSSDPDFSKIIQKKKMSWDQYDVLLRHLFESVRSSEYYAEYMDSTESGIRQDAALFADIYAREVQDNPELEQIMEDLSIWWNDDLDYVLNLCIKSFEELGRGHSWSMPALYPEGDQEFARSIVRQAYAAFDKYFQAVAEITPKWDKNRICTTDLALIVAGLAEAAAMPAQDPRIIINEYVEISKFYSTRESRSFVNGVLDKLLFQTANK